MLEDDLLYAVADGAATITVNRPDSRNSFTWAMWDRLKELALRAGADPEVRAVVIRGAGGQAFASGADLRQMEGISAEEWRAGRQRLTEALDALIHLDKPVIAQIQGYALGAGFELALACDLRYASPEARLGIPAARLGIVLSLENYQRLVALLGQGRCSELALTARLWTAQEAAAAGLLNAVVPADQLDAHVRAVVSEICACSPAAIAGAKRSIVHSLPRADVDPEAFAMAAFASPEFREGVRAFLEKRPPDWRCGARGASAGSA